MAELKLCNINTNLLPARSVVWNTTHALTSYDLATAELFQLVKLCSKILTLTVALNPKNAHSKLELSVASFKLQMHVANLCSKEQLYNLKVNSFVYYSYS